MSVVVVAASLALIVLVLWDAFEAVLLPRRVTHSGSRSSITSSPGSRGPPWRACGRERRNAFLSLFGPLSVLVLIGVWAAGLITGFALLHWSLATGMQGADGRAGVGIYFYLSGTTFFTLGFGDVTPVDPSARPGGRRGGPGLRLPRRGHQLPPGPLPGVLRPRGDDLAPGRPRRLAADGRPAADPARPRPQRRRARPVPGGVGAVGGRGAGEPHLVPDAQLLPLAARQPVVAGGADGRAGRLGAGAVRGGGGRRVPGRTDLRHGPPRGRRPGAGLSGPADRAGPGPAARSSPATAPGGATRGGPAPAGGQGG
ncbi:MAG: hypothetical protein WKF75_12355 [Singulisphaera sp.]